MSKQRLVTITLAIVAMFGGLFWSGNFVPRQPQQLVATAQALVGRPATPVSVAGVARRTTRRAIAFR